jgi:hypothetical protein
VLISNYEPAGTSRLDCNRGPNRYLTPSPIANTTRSQRFRPCHRRIGVSHGKWDRPRDRDGSEIETGLTPTLYGSTIDGAIGVERYREHPLYKWVIATNLVANHFSRPPHLVGLGRADAPCLAPMPATGRAAM